MHRVADLVVFSQKLIFEIQCSPITLEEVQERNRDYAFLGFRVIWFLHHRKFNQKTLSPSELYLRRRHLSYFASITQGGHVLFYDQLEFFDGLHRVYKSPPFILKNFIPQALSSIPRIFPKTFREKLSYCPFYLPGDLFDHLLTKKNAIWVHALERKIFPSPFKKGMRLFRDFFLYLLYLSRGVAKCYALSLLLIDSAYPLYIDL